MSAYLISQVEVLDAEAWENYRIRAAAAIAGFGGRYLVRGARAEVIEADWPADEPPPQTVIVAEFPSMKALKDWYASPEYAEAFAFRAAAVKRRMIFVAGIEEPVADSRGDLVDSVYSRCRCRLATATVAKRLVQRSRARPVSNT